MVVDICIKVFVSCDTYILPATQATGSGLLDRCDVKSRRRPVNIFVVVIHCQCFE